MDAWGFDNVKSEKANALIRYNRVQTLAKLFRFVEICSILVILVWISSRLPFAVRISVDYLRQLFSLIGSPIFVFVVGNLIVVTLRVKSGKFSAQTPEIEIRSGSENIAAVPPEEIVPREKEIVIEEAESVAPQEASPSVVADSRSTHEKSLRRSQSENLKRGILERPCRKLARSETERFCKISGEEAADTVEELSSEEFRRTVEEFIARQVKFRREEKLIIVPCSN